MTWRGFFEGIGEFFQWAFGGIEFLGQGFNGIGMANVFWSLVITVATVYWLGQMFKHSKNGEQ